MSFAEFWGQRPGPGPQYVDFLALLRIEDKRRKAAEKYVADCLIITDGSAEAGIARIGTARFEELVKKVMEVLP